MIEITRAVFVIAVLVAVVMVVFGLLFDAFNRRGR
jgi:hypothetical protein